MTHHTRPSIRPGLLIAAAILSAFTLSGCTGPTVPEIERDEHGGRKPYVNLEERRPFGWGSDTHPAEIVGDNLIKITYTINPSETCVRDDVEVVETPESIIITLYTGYLKGYKELPCPTLIELDAGDASMFIETKEPVGDREIINGYSRP